MHNNFSESDFRFFIQDRSLEASFMSSCFTMRWELELEPPPSHMMTIVFAPGYCSRRCSFHTLLLFCRYRGIPNNLLLSGQPLPYRNNLDCISVFFYDLAFVVCNQENIVAFCVFRSCDTALDLTLPGFLVGNVITHLIYGKFARS